ncbi:putative ATP-dependent endonuclease of OLD family [Pasteurella langaaensis DSM 22999]|uniref:Putative ATP-dependent endonuclease of OLD family n=1 Tax=Alitibacter langaaensis DSM 22999 TaxID=1122935 RepID=A0A2U0SKR0_9PAST|nr:DUF2813 domain-containing protein [Pasteurella langaaensis]PVX31910.1 putative ATP-dependent endonuclease of OLD family [Pasteurella langaaensis DSM 22999]
MYLRQLEIMGFRGIKRLSIHLRPNMLLIGENAWGKSSLLAALSLILNGKNSLYQFTAEDFHQSDEQQDITLLFTFSARDNKEDNAKHNQDLQSVLVPNEDGLERIYLRVSGEKQNDKIITHYSFLNEQGEQIEEKSAVKIAKILINRYPIYRFRDAYLNKQKLHSTTTPHPITDGEYSREFNAIITLLQHYFMQTPLEDPVFDATILWDDLKQLCAKLKQDESRQLQRQFLALWTSLITAENHTENHTENHAEASHLVHPILIFETPESRLHPRMVAILWELTQYLPIQRITTTNSVELISQAALRDICRLVRYTDRTRAYQLARNDLGKEDLRRLTFHVHHNRSLALFARTWILVEGETEVWILNELAELLGVNLDTEGVRIVEFAQSGLRPLIKYAQAMGIEWYVLTDGDEAGRKYAETVKSLLDTPENYSQHITQLPRSDIEHFFYTEGFEDLFIRLSRWEPRNGHYPMNKIIQRAIQRTSKPDLAIALSNEMKNRGTQSIPLLFKKLFSKVLTLTRTQ